MALQPLFLLSVYMLRRCMQPGILFACVLITPQCTVFRQWMPPLTFQGADLGPPDGSAGPLTIRTLGLSREL